MAPSWLPSTAAWSLGLPGHAHRRTTLAVDRLALDAFASTWLTPAASESAAPTTSAVLGKARNCGNFGSNPFTRGTTSVHACTLLDELFIMHGFYADLDLDSPGTFTLGEPVGYATNAPRTGSQVGAWCSAPARAGGWLQDRGQPPLMLDSASPQSCSHHRCLACAIHKCIGRTVDHQSRSTGSDNRSAAGGPHRARNGQAAEPPRWN